ncbi:MAG TPA: ABC transporter ATP-binding protein [Pyrinomonadaceae bacterium]|nr:ABC transporter ATP-binding protein [Pyrinomonadaceae bacterium]
MKAKQAMVTEQSTRSDATRHAAPVATSVVGISKRFGKTAVLENINFDVAEGEALVLLGASGSGKTTILRIIAGLEQPYTGKVMLHGKDVTELPARERGVGVIFQSYALFPKMTVEKNIGYGLRIRHRKRKEIRETVNELLALVQLEEHRKKYPSQLSGGQQQRVAIARTLAYKPEVLLFDEPFGALDAQTRKHLRREIRALLRKVNVPAIFITHDQEEALELGDRIAVINLGHIEQIGTPLEVYSNPANEYVATFLGAANILPGEVKGENIEVGAALIPFRETHNFSEGQKVKLVFRPEDVSLTKCNDAPPQQPCVARGIVEVTNFVGAYERVSVQIDLSESGTSEIDETPFYLTTQTPESQTSKPIIATRPKPEATAVKLKQGDRVAVNLTSFTVLPDVPPRGQKATAKKS